MGKTTATRRLQFCSGHRVYGHENKCANMHGHNYVVFLHASADVLDSIGRVIDFSVLKDKVGRWIEMNWDHTCVLYCRDESAINAYALSGSPKLPFIMKNNPTAENMASYLLNVVCPQVLSGTNVRVTKVVLWETENCFATVEYEG